MNINILPKKYDTYDCYQNNIIAVLGEYFKIDYRPFFWSGFDFRFTIDKSQNQHKWVQYISRKDSFEPVRSKNDI